MESGPILITGAAGFIGSHCAEALAGMGHRVVGVDNFDPMYAEAIKERNVAEARAGADFEVVRADICDQAAMADLFDRVSPSCVIHLAARAGVRRSIEDPLGYARANVQGTAVILAECARAMPRGCDRVVVASSSSVYGNAEEAPFHEEMEVGRPISPYAATKRACELLAYTHHHLTGMATACLRFFTVYGPRQRPDLAISMFLERARAGEPITMYGSGETFRDYTYISDIVEGVIQAAKRAPRYGYRIWNLGGSRPVTLRELIDAVERVVGREVRVERGEAQPGDVRRTWADGSRAKAELQLEPMVGLDEGLRRQWEWMQSLRGT